MTATYQVDEINDTLILIRNEVSKILDRIFDENETLIMHYLDEKNIMLFEKDEDLVNYLTKNGQPLLKSSELTHKSSDPYVCGNLELYADSYFGGDFFEWSTNDNAYVQNLYCIGIQYLYFNTGSDVARLMHFGNVSNWTTYCSSIPACGGSIPYANPNDKVSSVRVRNVFARFYEDANYGGRSITRDARGGLVSEFPRLKSVGLGTFGNWDNKISSVKLSN